jgi:hypothetical protein
LTRQTLTLCWQPIVHVDRRNSSSPINHIQKGEAATVNNTFRRILLASSLVAVFALGVSFGQNKFGQPKSILHVVTVKWKADSTAAQRQAALDGVKTMAAKMPGITNVWIKTVKVQPYGTSDGAVFAMEFKDQAAFDAYANHAAHKEWEGVYIPVREESRTHDVTN